MRKCQTCDLDYPEDVFFCQRCGLPTDDAIDESKGLFGEYEDIQEHNFNRSSIIYLWVRIISLNILALLFVIFLYPKFWNFVLLIFNWLYTYDQLSYLKKRKFQKELINHNLIANIIGSIWIIVFSAFFFLVSWFGGTPAGQHQILNCESCDIEKYYLFNKGMYTEVDFETYQFMGVIEYFIILVSPVLVFIYYTVILINKNKRKQKDNSSQP